MIMKMKHQAELFTKQVDETRSFMKQVVLIFFTCTLFAQISFARSGEELYRKCIGCHGKDAKHAPFEKESGILYGREVEELKIIMKAIRDGDYPSDKLNIIMQKSIKSFSDEDIDLISKYIKAL